MRSIKRVLSACVGVAVLVGAMAAPALATVGGPVSTVPATWTPHFPTSTTAVEQVRQLAQCGATMYAVGTFTTIESGTSSLTRNNAFSFNASTGAVSTWDPNVNGTVNTITFSADCTTAYLGGAFTSVHGTVVKNLAAVSTATGAVNLAFAHVAGGQVEALRLSGTHLLVGGFFTSINGSARGYMASLSPVTGKDDGYVNLNISGSYSYVDFNGKPVAPNATRTYNFEVSPDGKRLLVMGVFTSVAGQPRQQIFMLDLGATSATLDAWNSPEFSTNCSSSKPFYLQAAAWSPTGSTVYVGTTGGKPANGLGSRTTDVRAGLCDAAAAYPSTSSSHAHTWINYTGCDSLFSIAADTNDVYLGGHERWAGNAGSCNTTIGSGAVSRPGVGSLSPTSGVATAWNPTRARGLGADDMIVTTNPAGLWIASDNYLTANQCGGVTGLAGICFLPA